MMKFTSLNIFLSTAAASGPGWLPYRDFTIKLRHTTNVRTLLDEWSVRRSVLYLTPHNTHKKQSSISMAGFKPAFSKRTAADPHLSPRGHWDRLIFLIPFTITSLGVEVLASFSVTDMRMTFCSYNEPSKGLTAKGRGLIGQVHFLFSFSLPITVL
jgi:hypothetical protein